MIRLAAVIDTFGADFLAQYRDRLTSEHTRALAAIKHCRSQYLALPLHLSLSPSQYAAQQLHECN